MRPFNPWSFRDPALLAGGYDQTPPDRPAPGQPDGTGTGPAEADRGYLTLVGYDVEATDGGVGSVDEASDEAGESWLVVDTGPWIFGRKVLLPAGTVRRVDHLDRKVHVDRTRQQIKDSPEYDPGTFGEPGYRRRVASYYEQSYRTSPGPE